MKKAVSKSTADPTLGEFFDFLKEAVGRIEEKLTVHDDRFDLVDARIDQQFGALNERINNVDARLGDIQTRLGKTQGMRVEVQDDLAALSVAHDQDSERVVNHELRVKKLEEAVA